MKLNFWQILGILLAVGALIGIAWERGYLGGTPATQPSTTTAPAQ